MENRSRGAKKNTEYSYTSPPLFTHIISYSSLLFISLYRSRVRPPFLMYLRVSCCACGCGASKRANVRREHENSGGSESSANITSCLETTTKIRVSSLSSSVQIRMVRTYSHIRALRMRISNVPFWVGTTFDACEKEKTLFRCGWRGRCGAALNDDSNSAENRRLGIFVPLRYIHATQHT